MRKHLLTTCVGAVAAFCAGSANANDELIKMSQNPKDWVMSTGDYANTRYSKLRQINSENVGNLHPAWRPGKRDFSYEDIDPLTTLAWRFQWKCEGTVAATP